MHPSDHLPDAAERFEQEHNRDRLTVREQLRQDGNAQGAAIFATLLGVGGAVLALYIAGESVAAWKAMLGYIAALAMLYGAYSYGRSALCMLGTGHVCIHCSAIEDRYSGGGSSNPDPEPIRTDNRVSRLDRVPGGDD